MLTTAVPERRPPLWPVVTVGLAVIGVGVVLIGAWAPHGGGASRPEASPAASAAPLPTHSAATGGRTPISQLADAAWVDRIAASTGIPARALAAYAGAAIAVSRTDPGCGIGWNTVAAIGLVESAHGGTDGATLRADGTVTPTIIGIPLDGDGTEVVRDTDRGEIDGDPVWDRAVGPMQFIPSTWATAGRDGNGDGVADIDQIDDAALSTAEYLCEAGGDLTRPDGWIAAVHAYNPSTEYNNKVAAAATRYAAAR